MKKAFQINCTIVSKSSTIISFEKVVTQTNQESEINVISKALRAKLKLSRNKLIDIDFDELIMRTANHRFTLLKFWTKFSMTIEELTRVIKCFESSKISIFESKVFDHYSLLLRLSWLFDVNAVISIREFKIIIDDSALKEITRNIIDSEIIFCTKHTLIMYLKQALIKSTHKAKRQNESEQESSNEIDSSNDSFEDDLFDVENEQHLRNFKRDSKLSESIIKKKVIDFFILRSESSYSIQFNHITTEMSNVSKLSNRKVIR